MFKIKYLIFTALAVVLFSCSEDAAVHPGKQLSLKSTGSWQEMDDAALDVGAGGWKAASNISLRGSALCVIGTNDDGEFGAGIYKFTGGTGNWVQVDGAVGIRIAVDGYAKPWVIDRQHRIYRRTPANQWQRMPGVSAIDIGVGGALNSPYVIGTDFGIYLWSEATLEWVKRWTINHASRIAVDVTGSPWVVTSDGFIYKKTPHPDVTNWKLLGSGAYDIGAGVDGSIFMTSTAGILYKWSGSTWDVWYQPNGLARDVTVDIWGRPIVRNDQNLIYQSL